MRIRCIKPEFIQDEKVASWKPITRLAYVFLWMEADDCGKLRAAPAYLRSVLFPYDDGLKFDKVLEPIIESGRLLLWNDGGQQYGVLLNFMVHQSIDRPALSRLPRPPQKIVDTICMHAVERHGFSDADAAKLRERLDECSTKVRRMMGEDSGSKRRADSEGSLPRARAFLEQGTGSREEGADVASPATAALKLAVQKFREFGPQCERLPEMAVVAKMRQYPMADYLEAVEAFCRDMAGAAISVPLRELGKYLAKSERDLAEKEIEPAGDDEGEGSGGGIVFKG